MPNIESDVPQNHIHRSRIYWTLYRQVFFVRQRIFAFLSFLILDNKSGGKMRAALLRWNGATVGRDVFVRGGFQVQEGFQFTIGDHVFINAGCCFDGAERITIGDSAQIAYQVTLITGNHEIGTPDSRAGAMQPRPISIGAGAWIGARAIILPGVTVGEGAVVAAGALVTKNVAANTLVGGVPAKLIRTLDAPGDRIRNAPDDRIAVSITEEVYTRGKAIV